MDTQAEGRGGGGGGGGGGNGRLRDTVTMYGERAPLLNAAAVQEEPDDEEEEGEQGRLQQQHDLPPAARSSFYGTLNDEDEAGMEDDGKSLLSVVPGAHSRLLLFERDRPTDPHTPFPPAI